MGARVRSDGEAERVAVEGDRAIEVGHPEVDMTDANGRVDGRIGVHAHTVLAALGPRIGEIAYPCRSS
jgi:hypothetical protein